MRKMPRLIILHCLFVAIVMSHKTGCSQGRDGKEQTKSMLDRKLVFSVCTAWGYNGAAVAFADIIVEKFPHIKIEEKTYPPPPINQQVESAIYAFKFLFILLILTKVDIFHKIGVQTPAFYTWSTNNVIYASLMTYSVCKAVETQLLSSGAFEITMDNNTLLWSKLETGRIPTVDELLKIVENHVTKN